MALVSPKVFRVKLRPYINMRLLIYSTLVGGPLAGPYIRVCPLFFAENMPKLNINFWKMFLSKMFFFFKFRTKYILEYVSLQKDVGTTLLTWEPIVLPQFTKYKIKIGWYGQFDFGDLFLPIPLVMYKCGGTHNGHLIYFSNLLVRSQTIKCQGCFSFNQLCCNKPKIWATRAVLLPINQHSGLWLSFS